jgi:hypothetical protein
MYAFALISFGVIIFSFILIGSPTHNRGLNDDSMRSADISTLKYKIDYYYQQNCKMPEKIADIKFEHYEKLNFGNADYKLETKTESPFKYKLCTNYYAESDDYNRGKRYYADNYRHDKGYYCHSFEIEKWAVDAKECKKSAKR